MEGELDKRAARPKKRGAQPQKRAAQPQKRAAQPREGGSTKLERETEPEGGRLNRGF